MNSQTIHKKWTFIEKYLFRWAVIFFPLLLVSIPYPNPKPYFFDFSQGLSSIFEPLVKFSAQTILNIKSPFITQIFSDTTGFYIHIFNVALIAIVASTIWNFLDKEQSHYRKLQYFLNVLLRYYLALQMLVYGFSKLFKWQFYLPEPNILYTPLGQVSNDLLYWSTMGISRTYTVFGGIVELLVAILLLFRKTRLLGAVIGLGVLTNVVLINFSYNISVKVYSIFLLTICLVLILPDSKCLFLLFFKNKTIPATERWHPVFTSSIQKRSYRMLKTLVIGLMLIDAIYMYLETNNFNDDAAKRPPLHGAYEVQQFIYQGDTIPLVFNKKIGWKRFFVHRKGYFIAQELDDEMVDFQLEYGENTHIIDLKSPRNGTSLRFQYQDLDSIFIIKNEQLELVTKRIDLNELPLMKREFHWTIDDYVTKK